MTAQSPHDVDRFVACRLQALRRTHKMSQEALGKWIGVTFQRIQQYERGDSRIGAGELFRAAQLFGVSMADFYPPVNAAMFPELVFRDKTRPLDS